MRDLSNVISLLFLEPMESTTGPEEIRALAARVPEQVLFGTSTWTYPGWTGLVYQRAYPKSAPAARMLAEYARFPLFRTVGIDSSFYRPPSPGTLEAYSKALPPGFPCVSKVWEQITVHTHSGKRDNLRGALNPDYMNAQLFLQEMYDPYQKYFRGHAGPFVFEFQASRLAPEEFVDRLDGFLGKLPREGQYGVEVRNQEFLTPAYFAVLREHGASHVFNSWTHMPTIGTQLDLPGAITATFLLARVLLRPGMYYDEAVDAFSPYDRIREPSLEMRSDIARLIGQAKLLRVPAYILVNNRAEGSAPRTIMEIVRGLDSG